MINSYGKVILENYVAQLVMAVGIVLVEKFCGPKNAF